MVFLVFTIPVVSLKVDSMRRVPAVQTTAVQK